MKAGIIDSLSLLLSSENKTIQNNATLALTNLSFDAENVEAIIEVGGASSLVQLLLAASNEVQVSIT